MAVPKQMIQRGAGGDLLGLATALAAALEGQVRLVELAHHIKALVVGLAVAVGTFSVGLLGAVVAVPLVSVAWSVYSELHTKDAPVVGELPRYNAAEKGEKA